MKLNFNDKRLQTIFDTYTDEINHSAVKNSEFRKRVDRIFSFLTQSTLENLGIEGRIDLAKVLNIKIYYRKSFLFDKKGFVEIAWHKDGTPIFQITTPQETFTIKVRLRTLVKLFSDLFEQGGKGVVGERAPDFQKVSGYVKKGFLKKELVHGLADITTTQKDGVKDYYAVLSSLSFHSDGRCNGTFGEICKKIHNLIQHSEEQLFPDIKNNDLKIREQDKNWAVLCFVMYLLNSAVGIEITRI